MEHVLRTRLKPGINTENGSALEAQIDGRFVCVANGVSVDHRVKLLAEMSQLVFSPAARG
ncbi:Uncharacterized protein DAT39_005691, partial [Clarias magur]